MQDNGWDHGLKVTDNGTGLVGMAVACCCGSWLTRGGLTAALETPLAILGWSGEWHTALVHAIESSPSRRYPTHWAAYQGNLSASAQRLLSNRAGHLISIESADAFCTGLRNKVNVLGRMTDPPAGASSSSCPPQVIPG